MSQFNLFQAPRAAPTPPPADPAFVRKHLNRLLSIAQQAERMPWPEPEAERWANFFPELTEYLPPEEGRALLEAFTAEIARLRAA